MEIDIKALKQDINNKYKNKEIDELSYNRFMVCANHEKTLNVLVAKVEKIERDIDKILTNHFSHFEQDLEDLKGLVSDINKTLGKNG